MEYLPPGSIEAFGLYLIRTSALVLSSPFLGTGTGFSGYKIALITMLSFVTYMTTGTPLGSDLDPVLFAGMALREVLIGGFLAFILQIVVLGVQVAGYLVGHEMAFNMARTVDPNSGGQTPILAHMYETFFLVALIAVDGHHWILRALSESYIQAPVGRLEFSGRAGVLAVDFFTDVFAAGLTFAAPIMVLLTLISTVIGLLTRAVPHLNIMEFGFSLRIVAGLAGLFIFAPALSPALTHLLDVLMDGLRSGLVALKV